MAYLQAWVLAATVVVPPAVDPGTKLTLRDVLDRARAHAPGLVDARAAVGEAQGRARGASPLLAENPALDLAAGRREGADERDVEVAVSQRLEVAGQRGLRLAATRAGLSRAEAALEVAVRAAVAEAAAGFYRLLHAQERLALARTSEDVALQLLEAAQKRYDAGDIAALDLNLAKIALGRARAGTATARAEKDARAAELRGALAMRFDEPLELAGDLRRRLPIDEEALRRGWESRPEIAAMDAEARQADAESRLGRRASAPDVALSARYEREEGTPVVWAGLTLSLPLFKRGQEETAVAGARLARARGATETARRFAETTTHAGLAAHGARVDALRTLEDLVLPSVEDNEGLSRRSFEVGQLGLAELLLVRREGLEARAAHLDALLAVALEEVALLAPSGGLR